MAERGMPSQTGLTPAPFPGQAKPHPALPTLTTTSPSPKGTHKSPQKPPGKKPAAAAPTRPCPEHTFLTDVADVRQMEQGLLQLLDDFHSGKLQAFSEDCSFEKMDQVREQQERLARLHFDLDTRHEIQHGLGTADDRKAANANLHQLMDNLQELSTSIHNLQKDQRGT